ncbi:3-hexulose-6-phosphate synthase [Alkalicoccus luteus]|uniref:3-hexulose-6-phosphate synthase n=1 Tax=Alkalicoccus luteus TaxID=1237094 RepID=A0A969PUZ7_9BACI|nr:Fe-S cluster assembly protein HesB [Alkalicoccus luteus]
MKLQLALDRLTLEKCLQVLEETKDSIDIIEVGTGVIKEYGMSIVREIRERYPNKVLLADMKTCDAATHETKQALQAGADITTVMAFSDDASIRQALEAAEEMNGEVMLDLLNTPESRVQDLHKLGVELVSLHIGKDQQNTQKLGKKDFDKLKPFPAVKVAVAGGLDAETVTEVIVYNPSILIVGSAITGADNPAEAAKAVKEAMQNE